jgi:hypothetical protein
VDVSGIASASGLHAVSGASYGAPPQQKMSNLFDAIDATGSGSITQAQFEQAFQTQNPPGVFQQQGAMLFSQSWIRPAPEASRSKTSCRPCRS